MKSSENKAITLVSLIITIIILLIIAGVAFNIVLGDTNAIDKAMFAKEKEEKRSREEALEQYLIQYNSKSFVEIENFEQFMEEIMGLDTYTTPVDYDNVKYYKLTYFNEIVYIRESDNICEVVEKIPDDVQKIFQYVQKGDKIVKPTTALQGNSSYAILENANLENYSYDIPAGQTVTLRLLSDMTITNENIEAGRAAINLNAGSTLNLQVEANVVVNSTFGQSADKTIAGKGGYAGIHVPTGATLNLSGNGTITCYGGDAGNGGTMYGNKTGTDAKCAGGGGAGAGIGGNGGVGGAYKSGKGANGGSGESCGNVKITGNLTVYAYGGAGGSGGRGTKDTLTAGGGGGYPAAGIGGGGAGGAGGTCCAGAGGYSGGTGQDDTRQSENGLAGGNGPSTTHKIGGCGYFQGSHGLDIKNVNRVTTVFGGKGNQGWHDYSSHGSGDGGVAGNGGNITVDSTCKIFAYNGNLYSDESGNHPCPIYLQAGIVPAKYTYISQGYTDSYRFFLLDLQSEMVKDSGKMTSYKNDAVSEILDINTLLKISGNPLNKVDMSKQGVGSGAGYVENSNGTYTVKNVTK